MTLVISCLAPLLVAALVIGMESSSPPVPPAATTPPSCPSRCGDVEIPYPFGIGARCAFQGSGNFTITCDQSFEPPRPFTGSVEIINVTLDAGEMRVFTTYSSICYNSSRTFESDGGIEVPFGEPLLVSQKKNVFTAIGCNVFGFLNGVEDSSHFTGCFSNCLSLNDSALDGEQCAGIGCCQTSIQGNLSEIKVSIPGNSSETNSAWSYNPCSYAFAAEKDWYNFSRRDLVGNHFARRVAGNRTIPLVLDWAIRSDGSCQKTPEGTWTAPACVSDNSTCFNATQGGGYLCNCSRGYKGNPYIVGGCTNIDECMLRKKDPETYENMYPCGSGTVCRDTPGDYKCVCKFGHIVDPKRERGCRPIFPGYATAIVVTIVSIFLLALLLCFLLNEHKQRVRRGFFDKNGGEILKGMNIKTFTKVELDKMTNHYHDANFIGKGHFGEVFMGTTDDNQQVAVKRPILEGKKNQDGKEFVDEITFQFKLKHSNLVRLIGCCLEMNVPSLVFEFIPNGSLYDVLHGASKSCRLSLTKRLDIAIGSAEAVSYMHSHGDHKHVHGDIKSANILLDGDLLPKVSDFGSSKLLSIDMYTHAVAADRNYVDPVYMKTDRFTAKSDVYSFGVVLLELITRKTAIYDGNNSLPIDFVRCYKGEGNGRKMYDTDILMNDGDVKSSQFYMECLDRIGELAVRCLNELDEDERPTMAEVVEDLKQVKSMVTGGSRSEIA